jgi:hypothetical protein
MTAAPEYRTQIGTGESLAPTLRAAHEIWLREANRYLLPLSMQEEPFWSRWTAVRFMADQFTAQYRRERALLNELLPFLPPETAERLNEDGDHIGRVQEELDRVGRRRCTAHTVSVVSQRLLQMLHSWCTAFEVSAGSIRLDLLTATGRETLIELERYVGVHT